jgi:hypothetical protein
LTRARLANCSTDEARVANSARKLGGDQLREAQLTIWEAPRAFRELALSHFAFLAVHGFTLTDDSATPFVEFTSPKIKVSLYYNIEERDSGPDVSVGRVGPQPGRAWWTLAILARLAGRPREAQDPALLPRTRMDLDRALMIQAADLRTIGHGLLDGNVALLDEADAEEAASIERWTRAEREQDTPF